MPDPRAPEMLTFETGEATPNKKPMPWDDELEPFRYAGEGAPVRWLHQVV